MFRFVVPHDFDRIIVLSHFRNCRERQARPEGAKTNQPRAKRSAGLGTEEHASKALTGRDK